MEESQETAPLARVAEACAMALAGAAICALPTVLRAGAAGGGLVDSMLSAMAVLLCVLTPLALLLPKAARGWRGVVGQTTPRRLVVGLGMWVLLSGLLFMFLGTFLKANTHHRGLGGATFGVVAAVSALVLAVLVARGVAVARDLETRVAWRWPLRAGAVVIVAGSLAVIGSPLLAAEGGGAHARAAVFDVLLGSVVVGLLLTRRTPSFLVGAAKLMALPIALSIAVIGVVRVDSTGAAAAIHTGGGLVAAILHALEGWTDRDGDGMGSHFGGRDCDEGDATRKPGAHDVPGDGVDSDCDGVDGTEAPAEGEAIARPEGPVPPSSAATVVARAPLATDKLDIIVVTLDTVRADHTTVYGYDKPTTPNLGKLAARGIVFEYAYAAGSNTQRALMPVISGTTLSATPHTQKEWPRIRDEVSCVAERFKAAGYATGGVSSFTWVHKDRGFHQGFDELDTSAWEGGLHPEREVTGDKAIRAATRLHAKMATGDAPLYLWVHLFDAHDKYVDHPDIDFGKRPVDKYDAEIAFVDRALGKLIEAVEKSGRLDRTLWVIHGSHGEAFGEHEEVGHGTQLYDESIRVPLVVVPPSATPARYDTDAVSVLDIAPTILDLAGAATEGTSGVSLRPVLEGKPFTREPVVAYANRRMTIVDWPKKLHVFRRKDKGHRLVLFDLSQDPGEQKDLASEDKDTLVRLDAIRRREDETGSDG